MSRTRRIAAELIACAIVSAAAWLLYRAVLRQYWLFDDAFNILYVAAHRPLDYLVHPNVWQQLPMRMYTPLLMISNEADLGAFGLNAHGWYVHHLVAFIIAAVAIYGVARLCLSRVEAVAVALLFVCAPNVSEWVQQLMVRHYIEGTIAAAMAVALYVIGERRDSFALRASSAIAYLVASLCKEVFVPLPVVFLARARNREEARGTWPLFAAAAIYVVWRRWMLGTFFGGYGWAVRTSDYPHLLMTLPVKMIKTIAGGEDVVACVVLIVMLAIVLWTVIAKRDRAFALLAIALAAATLLPIVPVSTEMQRRYTVVPWLALVALFFMALPRMPRMTRAISLIVVVFASVVLNRADWRTSSRDMRVMSEEARLFVSLGSNGTLVGPHIPPAALGSLRQLKETFLDRVGSANWYYDAIYLCSHDVAARDLWMVDAHAHRHRLDTTNVEISARTICTSAGAATFRAHFHREGDALFWRLAPGDGRYNFLLGEGEQMFHMPAQAGFVVGDMKTLALRIRHDRADGTTEYSPLLNLDFTKSNEAHWP